MDSACPEKDAIEILRDSDHSTKVAPSTLSNVTARGGHSIAPKTISANATSAKVRIC